MHLQAFVAPIDDRGHLNDSFYVGGSEKLAAVNRSYKKAMEKFRDPELSKHPVHYKNIGELMKRAEELKRNEHNAAISGQPSGRTIINKTSGTPDDGR